jgi:hypothetical protein
MAYGTTTSRLFELNLNSASLAYTSSAFIPIMCSIGKTSCVLQQIRSLAVGKKCPIPWPERTPDPNNTIHQSTNPHDTENHFEWDDPMSQIQDLRPSPRTSSHSVVFLLSLFPLSARTHIPHHPILDDAHSLLTRRHSSV